MSAATIPGEKAQALAPVKTTALIVTAIDGIESRAAELARHLNVTIEVASNRTAALRLLSRKGYAIVVVDQILFDSDPEGCDGIWKNAGMAIPLQINFALASSARLERELRGALARREREQQLGAAAGAAAVDDVIKNAITSFLLESQLALAEENIPPRVENRLRTLAAMADQLRERLQPTVARGTTSVSLMAPPK
jgi:16S rRNA C967 or C1407 C5-methylase (RsmB/RsmF family)